MKKSMLLGGAAALALAGAASAGTVQETTFDLGTFTLEGVAAGEPAPEVVFNLDLADDNTEIVGFGFSGDYSEEFSVSWASDTRMVISGLISYDVGGLTNLENDWDAFGPGTFPQGGGSTAPGFYDTGNYDAFAGAPIDNTGGTITLTFTNDWFTSSDHDITWSNATFTVYSVVIPAPGAFAMLGVVGLAGSRRRRG